MTTGPGTQGRDGGLNLQTAVALLPTPTAVSYGNNRGGAAGRTGAVRPSLEGVVKLLPTPRASDGEKGGPNQRGSSGDPMLPTIVNRLARLNGSNTPLLSTDGSAS